MAFNNGSSSLHESPSRFFKVILPSSLEEMKLRIPQNFVKKFGPELSDAATLIVSNGRIWKVCLRKNRKGVWFHHGWNDFTEYYSISAGYFLVFKYAKNSTFHVFIFNLTACEIDYPCKNEESKTEELLEKNESDNDIEYDLWASLEEMGICIAKKQRTVTSEESKRAWKIARSLRPKNPSFIVIMHSSEICRRTIYVPGKFANEFLCRDTKTKFIKIQVSNKREQILPIYWKHKGGCVFTWTQLMMDKKLEEGDICIFELIRKNDFLLKLSVFQGEGLYTETRPQPTRKSGAKPALRSTKGMGIKRNRQSAASLESSKVKQKCEPQCKKCKQEELMVEKNESDDGNVYDLCALLGKMGIYVAERRKLLAEASKRAVKVARSLKLKKPTFMIILRPSDIKYGVVYVPSKFANKYFSRNVKAIKVQVSDDQREQPFQMHWRVNGGPVIMKGWDEVLKNKNLVDGDICVFELIRREDVLLKLSIFQA